MRQQLGLKQWLVVGLVRSAMSAGVGMARAEARERRVRMVEKRTIVAIVSNMMLDCTAENSLIKQWDGSTKDEEGHLLFVSKSSLFKPKSRLSASQSSLFKLKRHLNINH